MSTPEKTITIGEFKSWLQGIKDMLGDDWTPNAEQWKRICEKIDHLKDEPVVSQPLVVNPPPRMQPPVPMMPAVPAGPSSLSPGHSIPHPPQMVQSPGGMSVLKGPMATGSVGSNVGIPVKTPSIDTSGGKYDSAFE